MHDVRQVRILIVGAGGLGGPIALALGDRALTIVDPDVVERSNLHRQIQFTDEDLGRAKATVLASRIPGATGIVGRYPIDRFDDFELIVDASDDPATKFAVCDAAMAARIPYVIASALRYGGNVMIGAPGAGCYRCLFEEPPTDAPTCAAAGVLGPVVGAIGGVAAAHAARLADGDRGEAGSIWVFDDVRFDRPPRVVRFEPRADCVCARWR